MEVKTGANVPISAEYRRAPVAEKDEPAARQKKGPDLPGKARPEDADGIRRAVREAVRAEALRNRELRIEVEQDLNLIVVKIVDKESGEVVRQIPMAESVENARHLREQMARMARDQSGFAVSREA